MGQKDKIYRITFGVSLIILAFLVYLLHWLIFRDFRHILLYLIGDIAFLFIQVLLVTMIIEQFLNERERRSKFQKLNMVIGAFFSEVGTPLLRYFMEFDKKTETLQKQLSVDDNWREIKGSDAFFHNHLYNHCLYVSQFLILTPVIFKNPACGERSRIRLW